MTGRIRSKRKTMAITTEEMTAIDNLFYSYANSSSKIIDPEGIQSLCSDLEVDVADIRILMLAWKMQAERQGYFTMEEWRKGLGESGEADILLKLKKTLPDIESEVRREKSTFIDFYSYTFQYCLIEERQRTIEINIICTLLDLVLGSEFQQQVDSLIEYLGIQTDYKVLSLDQWMGFYHFCNEISFPDFSNYDPNLGWPSILDDFVDWKKV